MGIPSQGSPPGLTDLQPLLPGLVVSLLAYEGRHLTDKEKLYYRVYLRLVDKALGEYERARALIEKQSTDEEGRFYVVAYVNSLENCLNATRRLIQLLERVPHERGGLSIDREQRRRIDAHKREIHQVRHLIEHIETDLDTDGLGGAVMLGLSEDGMAIVLRKERLAFGDLAGVLRALHAIGRTWLEDFAAHGANESMPDAPPPA